MAGTTLVLLGDRLNAFIDEQVRSGRYATASDVMRAALQLLEREDRLESLRREIAEADADYRAGNVIEVDDRFWQDLEREVTDRAARGEKPGGDVLP